MDKKSFLNSINFEDKNLLSNLYDKLILAEKVGRPIFTSEFYPPKIWRAVRNLGKGFLINIYDNGIFEDSDRRMLCMALEEPGEYPSVLLKIQNKSKFQSLEHKDYLGAIMALGIKREKYGDLILKEDSCYAAVTQEVCDYLLYNLTSVGKCPCRVEIVDKSEAVNISVKYESIMIHSTSLRLDCMVSAITNLSRAKAVELIQSTKVLVDYAEAAEKDELLEAGSVITIRGFGKFKFLEQLGSTQRGRLKLSMKKYI